MMKKFLSLLLTFALVLPLPVYAQGPSAGLPPPIFMPTATGSVNTLAVTVPGATLTPGQIALFIPNNANTTTTPTLALNGLTAKTVTKYGATALAAGDLTTTAIAVVIYDGTEWQLQNPQTSISSTNFSGIGTGTNATATMTVGTGGVITFSGSGTVNANQLNGGAAPLSATVLGTNGSNQLISQTTSGSGSVVLATNGVLTTPNLGTPSAVVLTNATGLPFGAIVTGSNTTAAMTVGTGGSLTVAGSGTINATSVNGNTFPASAGLTSGGALYASSTGAVGSSALLTNHGLLVGGGAGAAPAALSVGGANFPLIGQAAANPIFSTIAYPTALTSGGILYGSSTTALASSGALTASAIVLGGGAGAAPTVVASLGTTTTVLHGNAAGAPSYGAVALASDVSGVLPFANMSQSYASNPQTATYQVLAADFTGCKVIPVASGTFTITLVASGSQPANGQCIDVINYGSGVVTIARSGQLINGGTSNLTLPAASATAPVGAFLVSDGTNYQAALYAGSAGGAISGLTTGYFPKATSATTIGNSLCDEGITAANTLTCTDTAGMVIPSVNTTGAGSGTITMSGSSSGAVILTVPAAAGTPTVTFGSGTGTPAVTATTPLAIATSTGNITCATCVVASSPGVGLAHFAGSTQTVTSSLIAVADHSATGTPSSSTYYRGDNTWATPAGSISGLTTGFFTKAASATTIANSLCDEGITTVNTITCTDTAGMVIPSVTTSGTGSGTITMSGSSSGTVTITVPAAAGTPTVTWGSSTGTPAVTASSPLGITTSTGNITCATCVVASSPGVGIAHFAGSTQTVTSSLIAIADHSATGTPSSTTFYRGDNTWAAPGGGGFPSSTAGQTYFSSGTTGTATSGILVGVTSGALTGAGLGIGGIEVQAAPIFEDSYGVSGATSIQFNGSCASGTTASCAITGGTALDPNGGVVWAGYADGSNDGEFIKYTGATSTTITGMTRGYWGSAAATHGSTVPIDLVTQAWVSSTTTAPYMIMLANGATYMGALGSISTNTNNVGTGALLATNGTFYALAGAVAFSNKGNNKNAIILNSAAFSMTNDSDNATLATGGNNLSYSIATQTIATTATLTAITNAVTPTMPANATAAAAGTAGVLSSHCHIIWSQATGGTVAFAVKASAATTRIDVVEADYAGTGGITSGSFVLQNLTTTTTTLTSSGASNQITPAAFGTVYHSDIDITMNPGTSNATSVALFAETSSSSDTLSLYAGTGCSGWN